MIDNSKTNNGGTNKQPSLATKIIIEEGKNHQSEVIKRAVRETMEALEEVELLISESQKKKGVLRRDLNDLKEGRLDRIVERQGLDDVSKEVSFFKIEPKVEMNVKSQSQWYQPYFLIFKDGEKHEINNSVTKLSAGGSYKLKNGEVRYL